MALGKLIKTSHNGTQVIQECLIIRQRKPFTSDGPLPPSNSVQEEEILWTLLDPETNNVLVEGVDSEFLQQEMDAGRLEVSSGWSGS